MGSYLNKGSGNRNKRTIMHNIWKNSFGKALRLFTVYIGE